MRRQRRKWLRTLDDIGRSKWLPGLSGLWVVLVVAYFSWELAGYNGLTALLGEWQYAYWGQYLPWMTYLLLVVLVTAPVLLLLAYLRRRVRRPIEHEIPTVVAAVLRSETAMFNFLAICAGVVLLMGLVTLLWTFLLPQMTAPVRTITVQAGLAQSQTEGGARLSEAVDYSHTAKFQRDLFLLHRVMYFAPVGAGGKGAGQYFVEIPVGAAPNQPMARQASYIGILRRNGLPGPIRVLFKSAGIEVANPHFVLFTSRTSLCWPFYEAAINALGMGIILLILTLFQWSRLKRATTRAREAQASGMDWVAA